MVTVNSVSELTTALNNATGGEVIEIAASALPARTRFTSPSGKTYSSPVTITSLDTNNKAEFEQFTPGSGNLIFDDLRFNYQHDPTLVGVGIADAIPAEPCIDIDNVSGFTIRNCFFTITGTDPSGEITGRGIDAQISGNVHVTGCVFDSINDGVHLNQADNSSFTNNECVRMGSDGIQITSSDNVTVTGNVFHKWQNPRAQGHIDGVQMLRNFGGCDSVTISRNVFDVANGYWGQTFHLGGDNFDLGDPFYLHTNITFEDNLIMMGSINGFSINGVNGLIIRNNFMQQGVSNNPPIHSVPIMSINPSTCTNVTIENNIYPDVNVNWPYEPAWTVSNNHELTINNWGAEITQHAIGTTDGYTDLEIASGAAHTGLAGSRMGKRTGGWGGAEITPHPSYLGGNAGVTPPPVSNSAIMLPGGQPLIVGGQIISVS